MPRNEPYQVPAYVLGRPRTVVVNVFADDGPAASAAAGALGSQLSGMGYEVKAVEGVERRFERALSDPQAQPHARQLAAELLDGSLDSQKQILGENVERLRRRDGTCDFVVCDAPLALSAASLKAKTATEEASIADSALAAMAGFEEFNVVMAGARDEGPAARARAFMDAHGIYYGTYGEEALGKAAANAARVHARLNEGKDRPTAGGEEKRRKDMAQEMANEEREYIRFSVPRKGYQGRETARPADSKGTPMTVVKLPPHVPEVMTADGPVDVSNRTMLVYPSQVRAWPNDPGYYSVQLPKANGKGEPWTIDLRMQRGHWENPDGATRAEKGKWVYDKADYVRVGASELAESMEQYREERREWAASRREPQDRGAREQAPETPAPHGPQEQVREDPQRAPEPGAQQPAKAAEGAERPAKIESRRMKMPVGEPSRRQERSVGADVKAAADSARAQVADAPKREQAIAR